MTSPVNKKGILLVGTFLSNSVGFRSVGEDLAEHLAERGWQVHMTSTKASRLTRVLDMVGTAWKKRSAYAVAQVDVYSGPAFTWAEAACWTLRQAHKPYVLTLHGGNLPSFARKRAARVRRLLDSAQVVTTPSRYLLEHMRPYGRDMRLIPNPLNLKRYTFRLRAAATPCLIWLRAFHRIYNPTLAPDVIARLVEAFPDVHLFMIGPDKGDGSLQRTQERAAQLGVAGHLSFVGGIPYTDVPRWLAKGDIFLNTTHIDNTPVSVLEAMACGMCVVSTKVGGIPYLLTHEEDALLVEPDDPQAMAAAVLRLLNEPELTHRLSQNARLHAEQFDWSVVLPQWEEVLSCQTVPRTQP